MASFRDILITTQSRLEAGNLHFGHGYFDAHDEAVALVLAAEGLDPMTGSEILDAAMSDAGEKKLQYFLERRIQDRLPTGYIIGYAALGELTFWCDPRALVPRSPLMSVIHDGYSPWFNQVKPSRIVDVCCGGGSLGLLAAHYSPESDVLLLDIDTDALALAETNRRDKGLGNTLCVQADLLGALAPGSVDIILANPPYVDAEDMANLPREYHHEPRIALAAGDDGLDLVHKLLQQAKDILSSQGILFLEVGNSAPALVSSYPDITFVWLELASGGHGVCAVSASELRGSIELTGSPASQV
ncbi:MAG: 50S ribosomal protein L3 N(5)-glutamine methyltransferase [Luminiphilus sp.]|nr:50S ribosomal protein L3 N(5)-glutamine methyltransferase [Luminiphilus sp.]